MYKKPIKIDYTSFRKGQSQNFIVHPYFLKQYNNRWFLFCNNDESQSIINLALDRMNAIEEVKIKYIPNNSIDFNEYFEDVIGVSLDNNRVVEKILLKISNELLPYVTTKPIHGSQKLKEKGISYSLISLDLIPNYELESLILSYGEGMELLYPQALRDRIRKRVELINLNYKSNSADKLHTKL